MHRTAGRAHETHAATASQPQSGPMQLFTPRSKVMLWTAVSLSAAAIAPSFAASFPTRSIRMIVPVAAGGPTDLLARVMAPKLSESLGHQVIVDNRAGAN